MDTSFEPSLVVKVMAFISLGIDILAPIIINCELARVE
jgi:hypothetical protein